MNDVEIVRNLLSEGRPAWEALNAVGLGLDDLHGEHPLLPPPIELPREKVMF